MTVFGVAVVVMLLGALGWIVPALVRGAGESRVPTREDHAVLAYEQRLAELEADHRDGVLDDAELAEARDDLARELLQDTSHTGGAAGRSAAPRWAGATVAIVVPALSVALYVHLGSPHALDVAGRGASSGAFATASASTGSPGASAGDAGGQMPSIEAMVSGLAERLKTNPDDGEGWMMLGRSYMVLDRLEDARDALVKARERLPQSPDVLAGLAEVTGRLNGNSLRGEPTELLAQALEHDPRHPKSLWLAGIAAMQAGDRDGAVARWTALKATGALGPEELTTLDRFIAEANGEAVAPARPAAAASAPPAATAATAPPVAAPAGRAATGAGGVSVRVHVRLAPELAARIAPGDALFVFARAESGPPMPLAVQRLTAGALPVTVTLDESMAMMPQMNLGAFPRIVVGARISRSGNAAPSPGDLQGLTAGLAPADTPEVEVVIAEVVGG